MKRKTVLFLMNSLVCGGVEKAFLSSLSLIDKDRFDVTCLFLKKGGALWESLPSFVKSFELPLCPIDRIEFDKGRVPALKYAIKKLNITAAWEMIFSRLRWRLFHHKCPYDYLRRQKIVRRCAKLLPIGLAREYDFVFAYGGMSMVSIVAKELFKGRLECAWFHLEAQPTYERQFYYDKLYAMFDKRFCCSRQLAALLNKKWHVKPNAQFEFMEYYLNVSLYFDMAKAGKGFDDDFHGTRILSVGRMCTQKGVDIAVNICHDLKARGYAIRWYWIGWDEIAECKIRKQIEALNLQNDFVLLGLRTNPCPFILGCDIYVQPSRYEGYCIAVAEARVFNKPIVCTDFAGAREQIKDGKTGIIVSECSAHAIGNGVRRLLDSDELCQNLSASLSTETVENEQRVRTAWNELLN